MSENNPILNNPYEEPRLHYATNVEGELDYEQIMEGRRFFTGQVAAMPVTVGPQKEFASVSDDIVRGQVNLLVNLIRREIGTWRESQYPNITRVTSELLRFWFLNPERHSTARLFFAQREAIETAIWLNEVAEKSNAGTHILTRLAEARATIGDDPADQLPRIAFKMATGTGKTVVMAALILYHFLNRQEYSSDTRYADNFLVVAPGVSAFAEAVAKAASPSCACKPTVTRSKPTTTPSARWFHASFPIGCHCSTPGSSSPTSTSSSRAFYQETSVVPLMANSAPTAKRTTPARTSRSSCAA